MLLVDKVHEQEPQRINGYISHNHPYISSSINILSFIVNALGNCPVQQVGPITWKSTHPGELAVQPCFERFIFTTIYSARRLCMENGQWAQPDYSECLRGRYKPISKLLTTYYCA